MHRVAIIIAMGSICSSCVVETTTDAAPRVDMARMDAGPEDGGPPPDQGIPDAAEADAASADATLDAARDAAIDVSVIDAIPPDAQPRDADAPDARWRDCAEDELNCGADCPPASFVQGCTGGCCPRLTPGTPRVVEADSPYVFGVPRTDGPRLLTIWTRHGPDHQCFRDDDAFEIFTIRPRDGRLHRHLHGDATLALGDAAACHVGRAIIEPDEQFWVRLTAFDGAPVELRATLDEVPPQRMAGDLLEHGIHPRASLVADRPSAPLVLDGPAWIRGFARQPPAFRRPAECTQTRLTATDADGGHIFQTRGACASFEAVVDGRVELRGESVAPEGIIAHEWITVVSYLAWPEPFVLGLPFRGDFARHAFPPLATFEARRLVVDVQRDTWIFLRIGDPTRCGAGRLEVERQSPDDGAWRPMHTRGGCWQGLQFQRTGQQMYRFHGPAFDALPDATPVLFAGREALRTFDPSADPIRVPVAEPGETFLADGSVRDRAWRIMRGAECPLDLTVELLEPDGSPKAVAVREDDCLVLRVPGRIDGREQLVITRDGGVQSPAITLEVLW